MEIIKAFQNNELNIHITIKGTHDDPLFRASDIGTVLNISNIRTSIQDFDCTEKVVHKVDTLGGQQEVTFLTEKGLYQILFTSRKPIAKQFKNWVCNIIKEIRINGKYELNKQLEIKDNIINNLNGVNEPALDPHDFENKYVVYLLDIEDKELNNNNERIYKYGYTGDIITRINTHKNKLNANIKLIKCCDGTLEEIAKKIEKCIKNYSKINKIKSNYRDTNETEIIKTNEIGIIKKKMDEWTKECIEEFNKNKEDQSKKIEIELLKERKILLDTGISAGLSGDELKLLLFPKVEKYTKKEPVIIINRIEKRINEEDININRYSNCGHKIILDENDINPITNQIYSNCKVCRKKESDKREELNKDRIKEFEEKIEEENKQKNEKRNNLLNQQIIIKCFQCKKNKNPKEFDINKRNDQLYKTCTECRDLNVKNKLDKLVTYEGISIIKDENETKKQENEEIFTTKESINIQEMKECSNITCRRLFPKEYNKISKTSYLTCKICREQDKINTSNKKKMFEEMGRLEMLECKDKTCRKQFPKELNAKKDGFYQNCKSCRDKRKKYDRKKNIVHKEVISLKKKEYYQENKGDKKEYNKEYYDKHSKE